MNRTRTLDPQDTAARIRETQERVHREGFGFMICDRAEWDKAPIEFRRMAAQQVIRERLGGSWAWTERDGIQCAEHPVLGYFVFLPGFWTQIGSPENEEGRYSDEGPMYRIYVEPFFMGMHNVTERFWNQVLASERIEIESNLPKTMISWLDSKAWMEKASAIAGVEITFPWEEEWEGACRAGSTTPYFWGTDPSDADQYAWHAGNSGGRVHEVGQLKPNAWGLYDMIGNVWDWCRDEWTPDHSEKAKTANRVAAARRKAAEAKFALKSAIIPVEPNAQSASRWALSQRDTHSAAVTANGSGQRISSKDGSSKLTDESNAGCRDSGLPSTSNALVASELALSAKETFLHGKLGQECDPSFFVAGDTQSLESASQSTSNALEAKEEALPERECRSIPSHGLGGSAGLLGPLSGHREYHSSTSDSTTADSGSQSASNALEAKEWALSKNHGGSMAIRQSGENGHLAGSSDQSTAKTRHSASPSTCNSEECYDMAVTKGTPFNEKATLDFPRISIVRRRSACRPDWYHLKSNNECSFRPVIRL